MTDIDEQLRLLAEHVQGRRTPAYSGVSDYITAAELLAVLDDGQATCTGCRTPLHACPDCRGVHCDDYGCAFLPVDCEREMRRWELGDQQRAEAKEGAS